MTLPPGSGVLFRHYELAAPARQELAQRLAAVCRRGGLALLVAGDARLALACGADGLHLPQGLVFRLRGARRRNPDWLLTMAAHDAASVVRAARGGADAVLVSPVFPTASHPGAAGLGVVRFAALATLARRLGLGVYAMGGIDRITARRIGHIPKKGTAAITGMAADQTRR